MKVWVVFDFFGARFGELRGDLAGDSEDAARVWAKGNLNAELVDVEELE